MNETGAYLRLAYSSCRPFKYRVRISHGIYEKRRAANSKRGEGDRVDRACVDNLPFSLRREFELGPVFLAASVGSIGRFLFLSRDVYRGGLDEY